MGAVPIGITNTGAGYTAVGAAGFGDSVHQCSGVGTVVGFTGLGTWVGELVRGRGADGGALLGWDVGSSARLGRAVEGRGLGPAVGKLVGLSPAV